MRRKAAIVRGVVLSLAMAFGASVPGQQPEAPVAAVFDATDAVVNGEVILRSDVLWNLALDPQVLPEQFWDARARALMLRTLIDQRLLLQEASKLPSTRASSEEIDSFIANLAARFNSVDDATRFERRRELVGLGRVRLEEIVRDRLQILNFIDFRFRSFVVVTEPEIVRYFEAEEKPKLPDQSDGAAAAALAAMHDDIERLLIEEKINQGVETFLEEAQARAEIVVFDE